MATLATVGLVLLTLLAYARFLDTGFAATDSLPLVESSRLSSLRDVGLTFSRPLMADTTFALGEVVYRPFVALTFGIDYAIWGLAGFGYHLTNLALHLLGVLAVWLVLRCLGLCWWASLAGATLFAVHPLVVASVPVIARRDSVAPVAFFVSSFALLLSADQARAGRRRVWLLLGSLVLMALALLSKESAFAALALLPVVWAGADLARGAPVRDLPRRLTRLAPFGLVGVAVFGVRMAVLHGLGGAPDDSDLLYLDWDKYSQILGAYTRDLLWPFAAFASSTREVWPRLAGLIAVGLLLSVPWLPRRDAAVGLVGLVWIATYAVFCMALKIGTIAWLAYFALVGVAFVFAAGLEGSIARLRAGPPGGGGWRALLTRLTSAGLLLGLGVYGASALGASALVRNYDQWQVAGDVYERYIDALTDCIGTDGQVTNVHLRALPSSMDDGRVETNLLGVTLLEDWTVDAALRLAFPARQLQLKVDSWGTLRGAADTLHFTCSRSGNTVEFTTTY